MDVYARGIVVRRSEQRRPEGLTLVATDALPIYSGCSMTLVGRDGRSMNERIAELNNVKGPHRIDEYYEESDLQALLRGSAYHVTRIVELYVERNQGFEEAHDQATTLRGNTSEPRVYFEVSAFLSAGRAWFDALLRLLWKHYAPSEAKPLEHFTKLVADPAKLDMLPSDYRRLLVQDWAQWGRTLGQYRNGALHQAPLNEWGTTCWIEPHGSRWALTVRLPANPTAERSAFDFENGVDALDYCHSTLGRLVDLAEATTALPSIHARLDRPRALK